MRQRTTFARALAVLTAALFVAAPVGEANPQLYGYGRQMAMMSKSPVVTGIDFAEAASKNARFCVSDMDGNGRLEFCLVKMDETGLYRELECYEADMEGEGLYPVVIREPERGLWPGINVMGNKMPAYRYINGSHREERYYHIDTCQRKGDRYLTAQQLVSLMDGILSTWTAATEEGVCAWSESRPGMLTFTPETYRDGNGNEIDRETYAHSVGTYIGGAEKTDADFRWLSVTELEKAVALGDGGIREALQKSWQGYRFGGDVPSGAT